MLLVNVIDRIEVIEKEYQIYLMEKTNSTWPIPP
jgi:hypothetical protein